MKKPKEKISFYTFELKMQGESKVHKKCVKLLVMHFFNLFNNYANYSYSNF